MSWNAVRFKTRTTRSFRRFRRNRPHGRESRGHRGGPSGEYVVMAEDLERVFGSRNIDHVIRLLVRLRRMKGRTGDATQDKPFPKMRLKDRNRHHLTPQCRKGEPYYGGRSRNLLLIRIERHDAWHQRFHALTLEEVITLLVRCRRVMAGVWVAAGTAALFARCWREARRRKLACE